MLAVVAGMIGCPTPPTAVLAKYIDMLTEYPADLIEYSGDFVLRRHKWNTFPKVAEFIEPITEEYHERTKHLKRMKTPNVVIDGPKYDSGPKQIGRFIKEPQHE